MNCQEQKYTLCYSVMCCSEMLLSTSVLFRNVRNSAIQEMLKANPSITPTAAVPRRDTWPLPKGPPARVSLMQSFTGRLKLAIPVLQRVAVLRQSCEADKYFSQLKMGNWDTGGHHVCCQGRSLMWEHKSLMICFSVLSNRILIYCLSSELLNSVCFTLDWKKKKKKLYLWPILVTVENTSALNSINFDLYKTFRHQR